MKLVIIGHARHGKDTVAEIIRELYGLKFKSSSQAASEIFLYKKLKSKYGYKTPSECFEDRINHRKEWHDNIVEFNIKDKSRLAKEIMKENDVYVGMRSYAELESCLDNDVFDRVVVVFNKNLPLEPSSSFNIDIWKNYDQIVIPNNLTLDDLSVTVKKKLDNLIKV